MRAFESLSRRRLIQGSLVGGVGAFALAACGEASTIEKTVVQEVPVDRIVTVKEEVPVTVEVIREVEVEKIVEVEVMVGGADAPDDVFSIGPITAVRMGAARDVTPWNPRRGGTITHGSPSSINNLDPLHMPDGWSLMAGGQPLYDGLIAYGPGSTLQPWLADSWEISDDLMTYTFHLRQDVKFHDGTPFNAAAAVFNFELWMDPANTPGAVANVASQIERVEASDEFTLVITLNALNVFFMNDLVANQGGVVFASPAAIEEFGEDLTRNPVGTGPFKFREWKENLSLTLDRFDDYNWGPPWARNRGPAYPDTFISFEMTDVASKMAAFEAGEVGFMQHFSLTELQPFFADPGTAIHLHLIPGQPWYLQTNASLFPTDDVIVRRALIHATDRGTVTRGVTLGFGALSGSLLVPGTVGYNPELEGMYEFDIAKANKLLDDAGYLRAEDGFRYTQDGQLLEVDFPDTPNPFSQPYKLNIENAIGISVITPNIEWGTAVEGYLVGKHTHKWQGGVGVEGGVVMNTVYHSDNFGVPGNRAFTWYYDDVLDGLLDQVKQEPDVEKRAEITNKAHTILMDQALGIPLVEWGSLFPTNTSLVGGSVFHGISQTPYTFDLYSTDEG
jgi:peptide/nickel transport system substrate-binding protein